MSSGYPSAAYAPNGELWWTLKTHPGRNMTYGVERRLAAWLYFNKELGSTMTLRELRAALPVGDIPNDHEHFNRRMRRLRADGWVLHSSKDDGTLQTDTYRLVKKGWSPHIGPRAPGAGQVRTAVKRRVFANDGHRCVICGVGVGEPYPDPPESTAVLTIGHRIPQSMGGTDDFDNLQTECKRCNEQARDETGVPETFNEVFAEVRSLSRRDKTTLLQWLNAGHRLRTRTDALYDRARRLSPAEREVLAQRLKTAVADE